MGDRLDNELETGLVPGVRNWMLETACLSTVGTLKGGLVARGDELKERGLRGLGKEVTVADKGVRGLSRVESADVSLLMLFCGSERGDGLWTGRFMVFGRREDIRRGGSSSGLGSDFLP